MRIGRAAIDAAVEQDARTDAGPEGEHNQRTATFPGAEVRLADSRRIGVVLEERRSIEGRP